MTNRKKIELHHGVFGAEPSLQSYLPSYCRLVPMCELEDDDDLDDDWDDDWDDDEDDEDDDLDDDSDGDDEAEEDEEDSLDDWERCRRNPAIVMQ